MAKVEEMIEQLIQYTVVEESWTVRMVVRGLRNGMNFWKFKFVEFGAVGIFKGYTAVCPSSQFLPGTQSWRVRRVQLYSPTRRRRIKFQSF